jgi:hypothetical protein
MKIALLTLAVLTACASELVIDVQAAQDGALNAPSAAPESVREGLAVVLKPVLALLYITALPLALAALVWALWVFAPVQALVLGVLLLMPAIGRLLRQRAARL